MRILLIIVALALVMVGLSFLRSEPEARQAGPTTETEKPQERGPDLIPSAASESARTSGEGGSQSTEEPVSDPTVDGVLRSDVAFQGILFSAERGLNDLGALLTDAQAAIAAGDSSGYFDLSRIIGNCLMLDSPLFSDMQVAGMMEDEPEIQQLLTECQPVVAAKPAQFSLAEWQVDALERSASAEVPLAALELALEHRTDADYDTVLDLTRSAVESGDYRGYFLAADFLNGFHDPGAAAVNEIRAMNWFYLGCQASPYCEHSVLDRQLALDYTPAQIEAMKEFAAEAGERIAAGEAFALRSRLVGD